MGTRGCLTPCRCESGSEPSLSVFRSPTRRKDLPDALLTLQAGPLAEPGVAAPLCWFAIDGGQPGGKVSWRVEAVRNDEFVRRNGAPVEAEKPAHERGTTDFTDSAGTAMTGQ